MRGGARQRGLGGLGFVNHRRTRDHFSNGINGPNHGSHKVVNGPNVIGDIGHLPRRGWGYGQG
eukprot:scaffold47615_cov36-Phaeocystis_antarctica.AAC.1